MRQRGFSLLEVLVAFTILALSLGVLMQIFSGSLRNADITREQAEATALAQSLLAGIGVETPMAAGESSGVHADQFRWRIQIAPFQEPPRAGQTEAIAPIATLDLWQVMVSVAWGGGAPPASERTVTLATLRVQAPPPP